jgi:hypothetical protein
VRLQLAASTKRVLQEQIHKPIFFFLCIISYNKKPSSCKCQGRNSAARRLKANEVQSEEAQGKCNAEYEQLKWIDNIMGSDDDHPDFDSSA